MTGYESVIGIEVHAQLKTQTKIFCSCPAEFGEEPNTNVCPVCLGLPGVLPVLNDGAVRLAICAGLALGCTIARRSRFARKHYFYPDLPKGYQITQHAEPLATDGLLDIPGRRVRIRRCHIEEDAGKLIHAADYSLVDFNRCGVPLIEIVTEPDLRTPEEAVAYLSELRQILQYLDVSDADMEKGHFRCELNISVRPVGSTELLTSAEIKNLNSLRAVRGALEYERERQIEIQDRGEEVTRETRLWDEAAGKTRPMRGKESAADYRYFPEPDLPPLVVTEKEIEELRSGLPELPAQRRRRYTQELGLSDYDARLIAADREIANYYDRVVTLFPDAKMAANWISTEVRGKLNELGIGIDSFRVRPEMLADLLGLVKSRQLTGKAAKEVFAELAERGGTVSEIVRARGLGAEADESQLASLVEEVLQAEPALVAKYRSGKTVVLQALVGAVMKRTRGKFPPDRVSALLKEKLG